MVGTMKDQMRGPKQPRRQHERAFRDELVAQSLAPGASVAAIAMKGGVNANLLFKWRRQHVHKSTLTAPQAATLLPVCVIPDVAPTFTARSDVPVAPVACTGSPAARPGIIEIEIAGAQLRLHGPIDEAMLGSVLRAVRQSA
jgi:transposase